MRANTPREVESEVLLQSGRRCCLCYGLHSDFEPKKGQIAHIDRDSQNATITNLAFLCLAHHDEYDSRTSQSKGFTPNALKAYQARLHSKVRESIGPEQKLREFIDQITLEEDTVREATDRLWEAGDGVSLAPQICGRLQRLVAAANAFHKAVAAIPRDIPDEELDSVICIEKKKALLSNDVPEEVFGVDGDEECDDDWFPIVDPMLDRWARGLLSHRECSELLWELDERYDLDYYYVLYGVPYGILGAISKRYLTSLIYEFGERNAEKA